MKVGHINLARSFNGIGEHFVSLVESLASQGVEQHVIACNEALTRRLALCENVSAGPPTGAAVVAYCLMPAVDVVHSHDDRSAQAGLLLKLTRSIPFVLTRRSRSNPADKPVTRAAYRRASSVICTTESAARALLGMDPALQVDVIADITRHGVGDVDLPGHRSAAEHLRVYHRASEQNGVPALLL